MGEWLKTNGERIYGSRPWTHLGEEPNTPKEAPRYWKGGSTARPGPALGGRPATPVTGADFRFTTVNGKVYAFGDQLPASGHAMPKTFARASGMKIERVTLPGSTSPPLAFTQTTEELKVTLPSASLAAPYAVRLQGSGALGTV